MRFVVRPGNKHLGAGSLGVASLLLLAALAGCSSMDTATTSRPEPTIAKTVAPVRSPTPAQPAEAAAAPLIVTIRNYTFSPQNPVLAVGQSVTIVNRDNVAHTWTAAPKSGWSYDSGNLGPGQRATFPGFPRAGHYAVLCLYHAEMPTMTGTVTVR